MKTIKHYIYTSVSLLFWKKNHKGFSLIELSLVIVLVGIIGTIGARFINLSVDNNQYQATIKEMNQIAKAIIGDETIVSGGQRADFGYVGAVGVFPANMAAIAGEFPDNNYLSDAWGTNYVYLTAAGVVTISSLGADTAAGGSGLDEDIDLTFMPGLYVNNNVVVTVHDARGNILRGGTHIANPYVQVIGATTVASGLSSNGVFSLAAVPVGRYTLRVTIDNSFRTELNEGNATYEREIVVYPKGAARNHIVPVRLPGALDLS